MQATRQRGPAPPPSPPQPLGVRAQGTTLQCAGGLGTHRNTSMLSCQLDACHGSAVWLCRGGSAGGPTVWYWSLVACGAAAAATALRVGDVDSLCLSMLIAYGGYHA